MEKTYFCFLLEWADMFNLLTEEQCGSLIKGMIAYEKDGIEPGFTDDILRFAWLSNIKPKMDALKEHYQEKVRKTSLAGKVSAEKRKQKKQMSTDVKSVQQNEQMSTDSTNIDLDLDLDLDKKEKPNKKEKDGWEEIFKAYDQRFPMTMSSYKAQQLSDMVSNYGKDAVLYAIREASTGNAKQPIAYIRSVAMNYSRQKENDEKTEPKTESIEDIGKRIKEETDKARAEGKSMTPEEMKKKVIEEMKRKGMTIVGNSTIA